MTQPEQNPERLYRGVTLRLVDLPLIRGNTIEKITFEQCEILGPAIILPKGGLVEGCALPGKDGILDEEGFFWAISDREHLYGAIAVVDCVLRGCTFVEIGVAVSPGQRQVWRDAAGLK